MTEKNKKRARYGTGSLWLRGRIWWLKWREVKRTPSGQVTYVQHAESTKSEDKTYAEECLRKKLLAQGGRRPTHLDPRSVSYEDMRQNFLERCAEKRLRSLMYTKEGEPTLDTLTRLDDAFRAWRAVDFTTNDLKKFRAAARSDGLTDARINRYMATLRAMFNQACKDELITRAETPSYFPMVKEPNEARGAIFIDPQWYEPLRAKLTEPLRSAFTLAYHSAIRVYELRRLRWRDIDVENGIISLPGEITKTGKPRLVPLAPDFDRQPGHPDELVFPLADFRDEWHEACVAIGAGHYVCAIKDCRQRCADRECPTHGKRFLRQLKYVGPFLRHCRHTCIRNMSDAGLPEARIMAISGHVTRSMFDRYNIGREKDVALARDAMALFHQNQQQRVRDAAPRDSNVRPIRRQAI